jgi:hypothetical protein
MLQVFTSSHDLSENGFKRTMHLCQYRHKCCCYCSFTTKKYSDRIVLLQSGTHTPESHLGCKGILSVKQRGAVARAARLAPMSVGWQVHASLQNFSPGQRVLYNERSLQAVVWLVWRTRAEVATRTINSTIRRVTTPKHSSQQQKSPKI